MINATVAGITIRYIPRRPSSRGVTARPGASSGIQSPAWGASNKAVRIRRVCCDRAVWPLPNLEVAPYTKDA